MAGQYVLTRNGRDTFVGESELRKMAASGLVQPGDLVYHPVLGRWLYARELEEIRDEMAKAATLGRPEVIAPTESNPESVAGLVLGILGHIPFIGLAACIIGIVFSLRGLKKAGQLQGRGHGLAIAGLVLSIVFLLPQTACSVAWVAAAAAGPF